MNLKDILTAPFLTELTETAANMYRLGWDERNSGNISVRLREEELLPYLDLKKVLRSMPCGFDAAALKGEYFLVTGSGKFFKDAPRFPERDLGIIRVAESGTDVELLWGFSDGGTFTSELPAHFMGHIARSAADPEARVVLHSHPTHIMAMSFVHEADEAKFSRSLWQMCTEGICVFPDGVGVLPWMICGTNEIGMATAEKFKEFRLVVWAMHGIYAAGKDLNDTFGLIETAEKAAQIYMLTAQFPERQVISDEQLQSLAEYWHKNYRKDFLQL